MVDLRGLISLLAANFCLSFGFSIFPVGLRGTLSNTMRLGLMCLARFCSQKTITSASVKVSPGLGAIMAKNISPNISSGIPVTATS
jgi:hypothetical protein